VRRSEKEIKDKETIDSILEKAQICRIGMFDGNSPYIVPMNFGYEEGILYFHCACEGRKLNIMKANSKVAFELELDTKLVEKEAICNWGMNYYSLMGEGEVQFLNNSIEKKKGLDIIIRKYAKDKPFSYPEESLRSIEVFKINVVSITGKKSGY